jgi:DNA-binding MarR family transcriptional regulator
MKLYTADRDDKKHMAASMAGLEGFKNGVALFAEIDQHMQLSTMLIFIFVAESPGCSQKDVEKAFALSNAAASRNISYWEDIDGVVMIRRYVNPGDGRQRLLRLTPEGARFFEELNARCAEVGAVSGQSRAI